MITNEATQDDRAGDGASRFLTSAEIGALVRTLRCMQGWTQETLAELSSVQVRTVQRVEQGLGSSLDTRRALARAFAFDDLDFLNSLYAFPSDEEIKKQKEAFDRDFVIIDARKVTGHKLLAQMQKGPALVALA